MSDVVGEFKGTLVAAACETRIHAYAPYSKYQVGAAVLGEDGVIYTGVNVENASYGLTTCAERVAIYKMIANGCQKIQAVAVCSDHGITPCGACRQVMIEFAGNIPVFVCTASGVVTETKLTKLLPAHFTFEETSV